MPVERKKSPIWSASPTVDDYAGAAKFLSLLTTDVEMRAIVAKMRQAPVTQYRAQDLLRASRLPLLPDDDPHVDAAVQKIKDQEAMPPILAIAGNAYSHLPLVIADGYHRLIAVYLREPEGLVPCKLAVGVF